MGVVQCLFAGIGTQLFAHVRRGQPGGLSRSVNFDTFGNSMLVLFQCMTSASPAREQLFCCSQFLPWTSLCQPCTAPVGAMYPTRACMCRLHYSAECLLNLLQARAGDSS